MPFRGGEWQPLMSSSVLCKMEMSSLCLEEPATAEHGHLPTVPTITQGVRQGVALRFSGYRVA